MENFQYPYEHVIHNQPRPDVEAEREQMLDAIRDAELDDWFGQYVDEDES